MLSKCCVNWRVSTGMPPWPGGDNGSLPSRVSLGHLGSVQCTNTKLCRQHRAVALAEVVACAQCHSARCPCQLHSDERVLSDASLRGAGKLRLLGAARGNKSVHSQFHRRVICVRKNKRMVGESECWTLILMCHWLGLEELYVLFLLQSAGKKCVICTGHWRRSLWKLQLCAHSFWAISVLRGSSYPSGMAWQGTNILPNWLLF